MFIVERTEARGVAHQLVFVSAPLMVDHDFSAEPCARSIYIDFGTHSRKVGVTLWHVSQGLFDIPYMHVEAKASHPLIERKRASVRRVRHDTGFTNTS